jgi:hypothetical protein
VNGVASISSPRIRAVRVHACEGVRGQPGDGRPVGLEPGEGAAVPGLLEAVDRVPALGDHAPVADRLGDGRRRALRQQRVQAGGVLRLRQAQERALLRVGGAEGDEVGLGAERGLHVALEVGLARDPGEEPRSARDAPQQHVHLRPLGRAEVGVQPEQEGRRPRRHVGAAGRAGGLRAAAAGGEREHGREQQRNRETAHGPDATRREGAGPSARRPGRPGSRPRARGRRPR